MQIYSLFMFLGIFTTLCIPETKRLTLEQLSGESPMPSNPDSPVLEEGKRSPNGLGAENVTKPLPEASEQPLSHQAPSI